MEPGGPFIYTYAWNRMGRKGQHCRVLVRGKKMNSCAIEFEDGHRAITSRNALRKRKTSVQDEARSPKDRG
jgi:hypothetical protein